MFNTLPVTKHEDKRRILIEYVKNLPIRTCKVILIKEDTIVGNHYHKLKDEVFYLLKGYGSVLLDDKAIYQFNEGDIVYAPRGVKHIFNMHKDSIILEAGTEPFDSTDDYK